MLKVYGDEMPFSKDQLGGKTEKDGSESAENAGFTQNITAMEMQEFVQNQLMGKMKIPTFIAI
ncbi:hypothetical protein J2Y73_004491 [Peribacillus frigoritolerans]|uniref:hypothetical protein n=1 Tax=Peribacillus frigoritolerans TaxID=450367 RepID=UPI00209D2357|nr:hypothetical protein [Peribacillus frigoritolerans]MCP1494460.1 hypothetical protein [Peribacillus frigoritolerans]